MSTDNIDSRTVDGWDPATEDPVNSLTRSSIKHIYDQLMEEGHDEAAQAVREAAGTMEGVAVAKETAREHLDEENYWHLPLSW